MQENLTLTFPLHLYVDNVDPIQRLACDGTMVGFSKDFLPAPDNEKATTNDFLVEGSHHQDRVYIQIPKIQKLLLFFCGINEIKIGSGGEKQVSKKFMSHLEYKELMTLL